MGTEIVWAADVVADTLIWALEAPLSNTRRPEEALLSV